jgi:FkbM family methyltransferase
MNYTNINLSPFEDDKEFTYNDNKFYSSNFNLNWFKELNIEPKVILDIGAYDFGDSIKYKIAFPNSQVYSFEADSERYEKTHKFAENCGVKTFNKAVFSKSGIIDFYPAKCYLKDAGSFHNPGEHGGQGSIYKTTENYRSRFPHIKQESEPVKISSVNINDFYLSENIGEITLVQIDAEGSELEIFKGFGEIRPSLIYVEVQDNLFENNYSPDSVHNFLSDMGYIILKNSGVDKLYIYNN